jgi:hypothetical protein
MLHLSQKHYNLDETYDWEGGLTNGDNERLYNDVLELCHVGKVSPNESKFLLEVYVRMVQLEDNINYPFWYY